LTKGETLQEFAQDRRHEHAAEQDRRGDLQEPPGRRVGADGRLLRLLQFEQDALGVLQEPGAAFGQADRARGPYEQPRAHPVLEAGDGTGHRRRRHGQLAPGGGEPAKLGNLDEHLEGTKTVHNYSVIWNKQFNIIDIHAFR